MVIRADVRSAVRYLRRRLGFAVAVVGTLAAGIAVVTTAYGVGRAVLWRALPFEDAGKLVFVWEAVERDGQPQAARVTAARFAAWRDHGGGFASLALFGAAGFTIESADGSSTVRGVRVTANYFDTLGIRAALGRTFTPDDERPGQERVVILADAFWRERLGARPEAIGEFLHLNGAAYRIVGVMPPVTFPAWPVNPATVTLEADSRQLWVPIARTAAFDQGARAHVFGVLGRLGDATLAQAAERLAAATSPASPDPHGARLQPFRDQFVSEARGPLVALIGAALVVLLIACANLAALYASAFEARRSELAVRVALGAGVPRLVRQLSLEALLLAFAGLAGGLALARVALGLMPSLLPDTIPFLTVPRLDLVGALVGATLAAVASLVFTAWPITRLVARTPLPRGAALPSRGIVYRVLVVTQVGLTMALVPAAALLAQSLRSVERQDLGFAVNNVLVADVGLAVARNATAPEIARAEAALIDAVASRPNVEAVAVAYDHPLEANWSESPELAGDSRGADERHPAELRIVSPGYFDALDVPLLAGRAFTDRDGFDRPGVALVNESFARQAGGHVLGRRVRTATPRLMLGDAAPGEFEIVGIVQNERMRGLERPAQPAFYLSTRQFPQASITLLARTASDPIAAAPDLRAAIRHLDPRITFDRPTSLSMILAEQLASRRVTTTVIGGFAMAALGLAALGMYGLLTVLVGSRQREIGVRLAIGASPISIARHVVTDGLRTALVGVVLGTVLSLVSTRLVDHLLVGITRNDTPTLIVSIAALLAIAITSTLVPALRAARIDPVTALRGD